MTYNKKQNELRKIGKMTSQTADNSPGALRRINPSRLIRLVSFHCAPRRVNFSHPQPYGCISERPVPRSLFPVPLFFLSLLLVNCSIAGDLNQYKYKPKEPENAVVFTVSFEANGGMPVPAVQTVQSGDKAEMPEAVLREGYIFGGWHSDEECETGWDFDEDTVGEDIVLYAKWSAVAYTVAYHANGGSGAMENSAHVYDEAQALNANVFTRDGYEFAGWAKESGSGSVEFEDGEAVINLASEDGASVDLYAVWGAHRYYAAYNANGGSGTMENSSLTYGVFQNLRKNAFVRTGYAFAGWNTDPGGSGESYGDGQSVKDLAEAAESVVTLYAQWHPVSYTVRYDKNASDASGTVEDSEHVYDSAKELNGNGYSREGIAFICWNTEPGGGGTDYGDGESVVNLGATAGAVVILYAQWGNIVTFIANNGSPAPPPQVVGKNGKITEPAPMSRSGLSFGGWHRDGAFTPPQWDFDNDTVSNHITLYAKWGYAVTFEANGGGPEPERQVVVSGGKIAEPQPMAKTGYKPDGWYREAGFVTLWNFDVNTVSGNLILHYKWNPISYTVHYNANDSGAVGSMLDSLHVYDVERPLNKNGFSLSGYSFVGWARSELGNVEFPDEQAVKNLTTVDGGTVQLYARWSDGNSYYVAYNANGGTGDPMPNSVFYYGIPQNLSKCTYTRTGYSFAGWARSSIGIVEHADEESVLNLTSVANETVTLYAKWGNDIGFPLSMNDIVQTDEGEGKFETQVTISKSSGPGTIAMQDADNVAWYLGLALLGTGNPLTVNPAEYNAGLYTLTVTFTHNGKPWQASFDLIVGE